MRPFVTGFSAAFLGLFFSLSAFAAHCRICGMDLPEHARNRIVLKSSHGTLPVCSLGCAKRARKYDPSWNDADVEDFNRPGKTLPAKDAYFLVKSRKLGADLGELAMPPYAAAFATKEEALAARRKYGDGEVVHGLDAALR